MSSAAGSGPHRDSLYETVTPTRAGAAASKTYPSPCIAAAHHGLACVRQPVRQPGPFLGHPRAFVDIGSPVRKQHLNWLFRSPANVSGGRTVNLGVKWSQVQILSVDQKKVSDLAICNLPRSHERSTRLNLSQIVTRSRCVAPHACATRQSAELAACGAKLRAASSSASGWA